MWIVLDAEAEYERVRMYFAGQFTITCLEDVNHLRHDPDKQMRSIPRPMDPGYLNSQQKKKEAPMPRTDELHSDKHEAGHRHQGFNLRSQSEHSGN